MNRVVTVTLVGLAATACGSEDNLGRQDVQALRPSPRPAENVVQIDEIVQVTTPKVDVLYVIDNSCSMGPEQEALGQNFPFFIGYFLDSGLDYHVGVTSTDMDRGYNGAQGTLRNVAGNNFIDRTTANATQVFATMASLGTSGSASERGIPATYETLEVKRDVRANEGFYRDEASIHTIIVSDEPSQRQPNEISVPEFIDWYDNLKESAEDRTFSSIVAQNGTVYRNVTDQVGGITWDILNENWRVVLDRLGVQAAGLKREYFLSQRPVENTIAVEVDQPTEGGEFTTIQFQRVVYDVEGNIANERPDLTYDYEAGRNSITFLEFIPASLSRVRITYDLLAATQDDDLEQVDEEPAR